MTLEHNQALTPNDVVCILAIAGRIDAQSIVEKTSQQAKDLAKNLDNGRHVYYAYAALDSLSSSYSMFKYFFDVCIGGSADDMHDLMLSPAGIAAITLEALFLVAFSSLACHFDGANKSANKKPSPTLIDSTDKKESFDYKKLVADAWPYFRDVIKGLKNAYKGWRSAIVALRLLSIIDARNLIIPVGVTLGVVAAANRFFMRTILEKRKRMMSANGELLTFLSKLPSLTAEEAEMYLKKQPIQAQTKSDRYLGFVSSAIGGFVDGLYLYVGVLTLSALAPPLLIAMASLCAFYTVACIVNRLYEEHAYQLKLMITQTQCRMVLASKQIQTLHAQLSLLESNPNKTPEDRLKIYWVKKELCERIDEFAVQRLILQQQTSRSYGSAILLGLKHGLYAYSALSSLLFMVGGFLALGGVVFPPVLIGVVVSLGVAFIVGFIVDAVVSNYKHRKQSNPEQEQQYEQLLEMKQNIELQSKKPLLTKEQLDDSLKAGVNVNEAPNVAWPDRFEVIRSLFSGLSKGQKFMDFAANPLQETDADGHYQDTPIMHVLGSLSALLFGSVFSLRALTRGFGRTQLGGDNELSSAVSSPKKEENLTDEFTPEGSVYSEPVQTQVAGDSIQLPQWNDTPKKSNARVSRIGMFGEKPSDALRRARSEGEITSLFEYKAAG